jgi:alkylated DNA nucleotide flippase Atl1
MNRNSNILNGEKLYQKRAKTALPYLVRQAKAGQKIYYSDLAKEIGMPNPRNLNYVLVVADFSHVQACTHTKRDRARLRTV